MSVYKDGCVTSEGRAQIRHGLKRLIKDVTAFVLGIPKGVLPFVECLIRDLQNRDTEAIYTSRGSWICS